MSNRNPITFGHFDERQRALTALARAKETEAAILDDCVTVRIDKRTVVCAHRNSIDYFQSKIRQSISCND